MNVAAGEASGLLRLAGFVRRHFKLLGIVVGGVTVIAVLYVLLVPVQYSAEATLLPQKSAEPGLFSAALALVGLQSGTLGLGGAYSESSIQEAIVRSHRMADLMDAEFDLAARYKTKTREARLEVWGGRLKVDKDRNGLMTVSFRDRDPEFSVAVIEGILRQLDALNRDIRSTSSKRARVFLENRLASVDLRLKAMEDSLADYQRENLTIAMSPGSEGIIQAGAELLSYRLRLEAERQVLAETLGSGSPQLKRKQMEIAALEKELAKLPGLNSDLAALLRTRSALEQTYAYLAAQLEEARMEEARDLPTVDVLDPPQVPERKSWPPRTLIVLIAGFLATIAGMLAAKLMDLLEEIRDQERTVG